MSSLSRSILNFLFEFLIVGAFCDLVWSDPEEVDNFAVSPRGAGWLFGESVTQRFMFLNNLKLICRAHQLVHEGKARQFAAKFKFKDLLFLNSVFVAGYKYMFNDKLVTVWSAPNYCYRCGNVASILEFTTVDEKEPILFNAVPNANRVIPEKTKTPYFL